MEWETAAQAFAAMGSEARLRVLRAIVRAGEEGLSVGEVGARTGIPPSTLAHHLRFLTAAEVIRQERDGRSVVNHAAYDRLQELAAFILSECCADRTKRAANDG